MTSVSGRQFGAFQGIPFAAPPVRELRFDHRSVVKIKKGLQKCVRNVIEYNI